jgi:hypothetical protein
MRRRSDVFLNGKPYRLVEGRSAEIVTFTTPFAPKQVTGDYQLSDFDPYSIVSQTMFAGGIGHLQFQRATEYLWGLRLDSRGERVVLGPERVSLQPDGIHVNALALKDVLAGPTTPFPIWFVLDATTPRIAVPFRTPTTGGGGSFQPNQLPNLVLWLKADAGVYQDAAGTIPATNNNDPVGRWSDQSGTGNHFTQTGSTLRPLYKTGSPPWIQADGVNDFLQGNAPVTGGTPRTIFVVVQAETTAAEDIWLDLGNRAAGTGKGYSIGNVDISGMKFGIRTQNANRGWTPVVSGTTKSIVAVVQTGSDMTTITAYLNGTAMTLQTTLNKTIDTVSPAYLFRDSTSSPGYSSCQIGEVIVYNRALSDAERVQVEAYLGSKWGIAVTNPMSGKLIIQRMAAYLRAPRTTSTPTGNVTMAIYTDVAGLPGSAVTNGTTANIPIATITAAGSWVEGVTPSLMASLTGDTNYWLVIQVAPGAGEYIEVATAFSAGQNAAVYSGSWSIVSDTAVLAMAQYLELAPDTPVSKFVEFNGLYGGAGRRLYRFTTDAITTVTRTFPADITDLAVMNRANETPRLLVAYKTGIDIYDGSTWTTVAQPCDKLVVHDNLFWRAAQDTTGVFVQGTTNFSDWTTAGTAGSKIMVGDNRFPITCLFSWRGTLWAGKRDGLYAISYGDTYPASGVTGQANKVVDLSGEIHPNNFSACAVWQDDLYFSVANGLARYSSANILSSLTPDATLLGIRNRGQFTALYPTLAQLFAAHSCDIEQYSQIMVLTSGGWHSIATSERRGDRIRALHVDSSLFGPYPHVWASSDVVVTHFTQPTWSLRRWTFDDMTYTKDGGYLYTSWIDGNLLTIAKDWIDVAIVATCPPGTSIEVYYRFEDEGLTAVLGTVNASGTSQLAFPVNTVSDRIQLVFKLQTTDPNRTPILWGYALRFVPRPIPKQYITVQLLLADNVELHSGRDSRSAEEQWADLLAARNATEAISFVDSGGRSYSVHIDQMTRQRVDVDELNSARFRNAYVAIIGMREA